MFFQTSLTLMNVLCTLRPSSIEIKIQIRWSLKDYN